MAIFDDENQKKEGGSTPFGRTTAVSRSTLDTKEGNIVMDRVIVGPNTNIGNSNIINTGAILEHGVKIADFCHKFYETQFVNPFRDHVKKE